MLEEDGIDRRIGVSVARLEGQPYRWIHRALVLGQRPEHRHARGAVDVDGAEGVAQVVEAAGRLLSLQARSQHAEELRYPRSGGRARGRAVAVLPAEISCRFLGEATGTLEPGVDELQAPRPRQSAFAAQLVRK